MSDFDAAEIEASRLDQLLEAGYCAAYEGLSPDACEEFVAASESDRAVWMDGYNAAIEHKAAGDV